MLIGSGGREHALARSIHHSKLLQKLYILPGNPGTDAYGENITLDITDNNLLKEFVSKHEIAIIVVGPEAPLVNGLADQFLNSETIVIGPSQAGAMLEGSKAYAKEFMQRHHIPTAKYFECNIDNLEEGFTFLHSLKAPYVLKADGLAAGKGVLIIDNIEEAKEELKAMLNGKFGAASSVVVVEEFLSGVEFSVFALTDGHDYVLLPEAKDYKRIGEKDTGLNTGGMGAISPVPFFDEELKSKVIVQIVDPTIKGLSKDGIPYCGFVFFGLINVNGNPFVIEYNCRMGDPETEVVFPRIQSDVLELFKSVRGGKLNQKSIEVDKRIAATVVMVSGGYPESYTKGKPISIPQILPESSIIFHSGTSLVDSKLVTSGGRVLAITSFGNNIEDAVKQSLAVADAVSYEEKYYRRDIGQDLL